MNCVEKLAFRNDLEVFELLNERVTFDYSELDASMSKFYDDFPEDYNTEAFQRNLWHSEFAPLSLLEVRPEPPSELFKCACGNCVSFNNYTFKECGEICSYNFSDYEFRNYLLKFNHCVVKFSLLNIATEIISKGELNGLGNLFALAKFFTMRMTGHVMVAPKDVKFPLCGCGNCDVLFPIKWSSNGELTHVEEVRGLEICYATTAKCSKILEIDFPWLDQVFSNVQARVSNISSHNVYPGSFEILNFVLENFDIHKDHVFELFLNPNKRKFNKIYGCRNMMVLIDFIKKASKLLDCTLSINWHVYNDKSVQRKSDSYLIKFAETLNDDVSELTRLELTNLLKHEGGLETSNVKFEVSSIDNSIDTSLVSGVQDIKKAMNTAIECVESTMEIAKFETKSEASYQKMLIKKQDKQEESFASINLVKEKIDELVDESVKFTNFPSRICIAPFMELVKDSTAAYHFKAGIQSELSKEKECKLGRLCVKAKFAREISSNLEGNMEVLCSNSLKRQSQKKKIDINYENFLNDVEKERETMGTIYTMETKNDQFLIEGEQNQLVTAKNELVSKVKLINVKKFSAFIKKEIQILINNFLDINFNAYYDQKKNYFMKNPGHHGLLRTQGDIRSHLQIHLNEVKKDKSAFFQDMLFKFQSQGIPEMPKNLEELTFKFFKKTLSKIVSRKTRIKLSLLKKQDCIQFTVNTLLHIDEYKEMRSKLNIQSSDWKKFNKIIYSKFQ